MKKTLCLLATLALLVACSSPVKLNEVPVEDKAGSQVAAAAAASPAPAPPPARSAVATVDARPLAAVPSGPTSAAHPDGQKVTSPSLGLFWRSPQPGAPSFVEVGQQVDAEDTVCIVEVMKLMNHVKAGVPGKVVAILVDNGAMVEFGQTLVVVEPGA
jgi:acetyl-CoA carboxylase biotin carboxyl carrier protein